MTKAALKKELREIDRQLSRFGVLIDGYKQSINVSKSVVPLDIVPNIVSYLEKIKNFESVNKSTVSHRRHEQCKKMRERLKSNNQYSNAQRFNPIESILHSSEDTYVKCHPDNIYGEVTQETAPYLWPLLSSEPENYRYISPTVFQFNAIDGVLTTDEINMFTMVNDIDYIYNDGMTAFLWACRNDHIDTATMLLEKGADIKHIDNDGMTAFLWACRNGRIDTATMLLEKGADINDTDTSGWSALMLACHNNKIDMARMLIDRGVNIDHAARSGQTALMIACVQNRVSIARLLIERGANVNLQTRRGWTALDYAEDLFLDDDQDQELITLLENAAAAL